MKLNYPGSKKRLAPWILSYMPPHHSYLEPYFGGGSVLFAKDPARIETVNDIDGEVINFFRMIQDLHTREQLQERLDYTPYARDVFDLARRSDSDDDIDRAANFAVKSMQTHCFRMIDDHGGWKKDVHGREAAYALRYFNDLSKTIAEIAIRLKNVQIENRPAIELIKRFDHENVLIYIDPPYVLSTRNRKQYRHEMTDDDHKELLDVSCNSKAMIMISGYGCKIYNDKLSGWRKEQVKTRASNNAVRVESLWMNF